MNYLFDFKQIIRRKSGNATGAIIGIIFFLIVVAATSVPVEENTQNPNDVVEVEENTKIDFDKLRKEELDKIPAYSNMPYYIINSNKPFFNNTELTTSSYEKYSDLDNLRKMWRDCCVYRKRFDADRRTRPYWYDKTKWVAYSKI